MQACRNILGQWGCGPTYFRLIHYLTLFKSEGADYAHQTALSPLVLKIYRRACATSQPQSNIFFCFWFFGALVQSISFQQALLLIIKTPKLDLTCMVYPTHVWNTELKGMVYGMATFSRSKDNRCGWIPCFWSKELRQFTIQQMHASFRLE